MRLALIIALCALPSMVQPGPDETVKYLMQDSASMLDFGLLRLNIDLQNENLGRAFYDWDENRIRIGFFRPDKTTSENAEKECAEWVKAVRVAAFIDLETGKPFLENSMLSDYFTHSGFARANPLADLTGKIDSIIVLRCNFWGLNPAVIVDAPLMGTGYSLAK
jgi:hypothetical protein